MDTGWGKWTVAALALYAGIRAFSFATRAGNWSWRLFAVTMGLVGILVLAWSWSLSQAEQAGSDAAAQFYLGLALAVLVFGTAGIIWYINKLYRKHKR